MDYGSQPVAVPKALPVITWAMLVVMPVFLLVLAQFIAAAPTTSGAPYDMVTYILLVVAALEPLPYLFIERVRINNFRKAKGNEAAKGQFFMHVVIMRMAPVTAIYMFGFFVFLIGGEFMRMLYFYPIGLIWTYFRWPSEAYRQEFMRRLEVS